MQGPSPATSTLASGPKRGSGRFGGARSLTTTVERRTRGSDCRVRVPPLSCGASAMVCATRSRGFLGKSSQAWGVGSSQQANNQLHKPVLLTENQGWVTVFIALFHIFSVGNHRRSRHLTVLFPRIPFLHGGDFRRSGLTFAPSVPHGCENSGGPKTFFLKAKIRTTHGTLSNLFFPGLAYAISLSLTARLSAEFCPGPLGQ